MQGGKSHALRAARVVGFNSFITERTSRFHPGCDLSSSAVAQPRRSHKPSATPGDLLTPMLQCRTTRSTFGQASMNCAIAVACSRANRMSVGSPISVMSLNESLRTAAKSGEMRAGSASGSEMEMQTSRPRGSYASASSRDNTTSCGELSATSPRFAPPAPPTYFAFGGGQAPIICLTPTICAT